MASSFFLHFYAYVQCNTVCDVCRDYVCEHITYASFFDPAPEHSSVIQMLGAGGLCMRPLRTRIYTIYVEHIYIHRCMLLHNMPSTQYITADVYVRLRTNGIWYN